jgi:hypothetical protein
MSKKIEKTLPPCGIYRTGRALSSEPQNIPAGILVLFHNHSNRGIPMLQLPDENHNNVWSFHKYGPGVEDDDAFIEALIPLREQGFYFLGSDLETPDGRVSKYTLVQLGYDREAHPILFWAEKGISENALFFPELGLRFEELGVLEILRPAHPLIVAGQADPDHADQHGAIIPPSNDLLQ